MKKVLFTACIIMSCLQNSNAQIVSGIKKAVDKKKEEVKTPETKVTESVTPESTTPEKKITAIQDRPNNGMSGPIHEKYVGKIVFAKSEEAIEFQKEIESQFVTEANLGDVIRYRVYMDNSLVNYLKGNKFIDTHGRFLIKYYLDGAEALSSELSEDWFTSDEKEKFTTFRGAFKSGKSTQATGEYSFNRFLKENESKLTPGKHVVKIEYLPFQSYPDKFTGPAVASGEITLIVNGSAIDPNDEKICMPKAKMTDKDLTAAMIKAYAEKGYTAVPSEVRILSPSWTTIRNKNTGIVTNRAIEGLVATKENGKCFSQAFTFYQDYDGSSYQKYTYIYSNGYKADIPCGCIVSK